MSTRRDPVPGLDALIPRAAPERPAEAPKNLKTTLYLPPDVMAAMDRFRLDLKTEHGVIVDRSALIAALWRFTEAYPDRFPDFVRETA